MAVRKGHWKVRAAGVVVLLGLLTLGRFSSYETAIWFVLLAAVLFAPIPERSTTNR